MLELGGSARGAHLLFAPAARPGPRRLLVFFHGAGGRADQGLQLLRDVALERSLLLLLPTSTASTWDLLTGGLGPDVEEVDEALRAVFSQYDVSGVAVGGFSDGASYGLSLGLANGDLVETVLAFSPGFAAPPTRVGSPDVWVSHGSEDAVLPVDRCGRRVAQLLGQAGYSTRYEEFPGGHVVPPELTAQAVDWWLLRHEREREGNRDDGRG